MADYPYVPYIPLREDDLQSPPLESQDLQSFPVQDLQNSLDETQIGQDLVLIETPNVFSPIDYESPSEEIVPDTPERVVHEDQRPKMQFREFDEELGLLTLMFFDSETAEERSARYEANPQEIVLDMLRIYFPGCYPLPENAY